METTLTAQEKALIIKALIAYRKDRLRLARVVEVRSLSRAYIREATKLDRLADRIADLSVRAPDLVLT